MTRKKFGSAALALAGAVVIGLTTAVPAKADYYDDWRARQDWREQRERERDREAWRERHWREDRPRAGINLDFGVPQGSDHPY